MHCPSCGAAIQAGDKFCFACGHTLPATDPAPQPARKHCAGCGSPLEATDQFCGVCGASASATSPRQFTAQPPPSATARAHAPQPVGLSHGFAITFAYLVLIGSAVLLFVGNIVIQLPVDWDDFGLLPIFAGLVGLLVSGFWFGLYLWTRKKPSARTHGKVVLFVSVFLLIVGIGLLRLLTSVLGGDAGF